MLRTVFFAIVFVLTAAAWMVVGVVALVFAAIALPFVLWMLRRRLNKMEQEFHTLQDGEFIMTSIREEHVRSHNTHEAPTTQIIEGEYHEVRKEPRSTSASEKEDAN